MGESVECVSARGTTEEESNPALRVLLLFWILLPWSQGGSVQDRGLFSLVAELVSSPVFSSDPGVSAAVYSPEHLPSLTRNPRGVDGGLLWSGRPARETTETVLPIFQAFVPGKSSVARHSLAIFQATVETKEQTVLKRQDSFHPFLFLPCEAVVQQWSGTMKAKPPYLSAFGMDVLGFLRSFNTTCRDVQNSMVWKVFVYYFRNSDTDRSAWPDVPSRECVTPPTSEQTAFSEYLRHILLCLSPCG